MAINIQLGNAGVTDFTLDESLTLQNATATPAPAGDANDEDISRATLQGLSAAFDTLLFTTLAIDPDFSTNGRIAASPVDLWTVTSGGTIDDIQLAGAFNSGTGTADPLPVYDGTNFGAGGESGLTTTDGEVIRLFSDIEIDPDGAGGADPFNAAEAAGLGGNVVFGVDSSGDIVLAILMIETVVSAGEVDLQFVMVTTEAIDHPLTGLNGVNHDDAVNLNDFLSLTVQESSGFDFAGVPPGKSVHLTAAATSGPGGVIVTPLTEVVEINTSNAFPDGVIGYGSQGINAGETVVMTWVQDGLVEGLTIPNLDQNEADLATNIRFDNLDSIDEASFKIQQQVGSAVAAVKVTALATNVEDGTGSGNFFDNVGNAQVGGAGDDDIVAIDSVTFTRGTSVTTVTVDTTLNFPNPNPNKPDLTVTIDFITADGGGNFAGQVVITGLLFGDMITYHTVADHERTLVTGVSGNVDIGGFSTTQTGGAAAPIGDSFVIEDAGVTVNVVADVDAGDLDALLVNLDETIDPDDDQIKDGEDIYAVGESESGGPPSNGDLDDVLIDDGGGTLTANLPVWETAPNGFAAGYDSSQPSNSEAIGELSTGAGLLAALFGDASTFVDFGTDGPGALNGNTGRTDTLGFVDFGDPMKTNLAATAVVGSPLEDEPLANREIWLVYVSATVVEGRVKGPDGAFGGGDDYVILRGTLQSADDPDNAFMTWEQFAPVAHPTTTLFDESLPLYTTGDDTLDIRWTTLAQEGDEDTASGFADVTLISNASTIVEVDDDGPGVTGELDDVELWEDGLGAGITDADGEDEDIVVTGNILDQVVGGSDGVKEFGWTSSAAFITFLDGLGLSSGGVALVHSVSNDINLAGDDQLTARKGAAGPVIYTVVIEEDGDYTVTLSGTLDHAQGLAGQPDEDVIIIDLSSGLEALTGDDDPVQFQPNALRLLVEDDAGQITTIDDGLVDFTIGDSFSDFSVLDYGADGPHATSPFIITAWDQMPDDTPLGVISESLTGNGTILTYTSDDYGDLFRLTLDATGDGGYTFDVLQNVPLVLIPLIGGATTPGGPVEEFTPPPPGDIVTFDGFIFTDYLAASLAAQFVAGDDNSNGDEDVNISQKGTGLEDNQLDQGEGLALFFTEDVGGIRIIFDGGTGGGTLFDVRIQAYNDGTLVATELFDDETLPKGNSTLELNFEPGVLFDTLYIVHDLTAPNGVRIPEIFAFTAADIPDFKLDFTVKETDFDGDMDSESFFVQIDSDLDGFITDPVPV